MLSNKDGIICSLDELLTELNTLRGDIENFYSVRSQRREQIRKEHLAVVRTRSNGKLAQGNAAAYESSQSQGNGVAAAETSPKEEEVTDPNAVAVASVLEKIKGGIVKSMQAGKAPEKVIFTGRMMEGDMKNFLKAHDPSLTDEACKMAWEQMEKEKKDRITPKEFLSALGLAGDPKSPKGGSTPAGNGGPGGERRDSICPVFTGEKQAAPDHLARMIHKNELKSPNTSPQTSKKI